MKHSREDELSFTPDDLRWATPEIVADYRARRLACATIADLGCGIGFQTFAFAKTCQKVYAVEINKEKLERAKKNAVILGFSNIFFIQGDALDPLVIQKLKEVDTVFCDPERLPSEEERTIATIQPNIQELLQKYRALTKNIVIELPPQIKDIPFPGEKEYLSLDGKLNRLTLYLGSLQKAERSAVILPSEDRLEAQNGATFQKSKRLKKYLLEADPAVVKAGLLGELSSKTGAPLFFQEKAAFFTADAPRKSSFFNNQYKVLGKGLFEEKEILALLKKVKAGKVTLRFSVDPKEYWKLRTTYEKQLSGEKKVALFQFQGKAVIAEKCL